MKKVFIYCAIPLFLYSNTLNNQIGNELNKTIQVEQQRKIFKSLEKEKNKGPLKFFDINTINLNKKKDETCIEIKKVNILGQTYYKDSDFQPLIETLLNKCIEVSKLNNLAKSISNKYIDDGFITSRAYIKPQDLSDGIVNISVLEGKVNTIKSKSNLGLVFKNLEEDILNIRDLEVGIEQIERLKSQKVDLELNPSKRVGYTDINIIKKKISSPFYGDIALNNFGSKKSGKYQISTNLNYENLLDLNDIFSIGINTTNKVGDNDSTIGNYISYSFPVNRCLITFGYSTFDYKQQIQILDNIYKTNGTSKELSLNLNYKAFHSKDNRLEYYFDIKTKKNNNYNNGILLDVQSYKLNIGTLGTKYYYTTSLFQFYTSFEYQGSFSSKENENFDTSFNKFVIDMGMTKYFQNTSFRINSTFHGQFTNNNLPGTESISMGGPYSIRGFNQNSISGNSGFYFRNELSIKKDTTYFNYFPYVALDTGKIRKDEEYGIEKESIIGTALGIRFIKDDFFLSTYYSLPLKEQNGSDYNKRFFGIEISYKF